MDAVIAVLPIVEPANANIRYDWRLNGHPAAPSWREIYPLPVLDPDTGSDSAWRRLRLHVVR